ncbi:hypothetical protein KEM55_006627 [Ascosphaera atra]|nr:hypothetical protein KEM55_006627 [Ascosphaera atra]
MRPISLISWSSIDGLSSGRPSSKDSKKTIHKQNPRSSVFARPSEATNQGALAKHGRRPPSSIYSQGLTASSTSLDDDSEYQEDLRTVVLGEEMSFIDEKVEDSPSKCTATKEYPMSIGSPSGTNLTSIFADSYEDVFCSDDEYDTSPYFTGLDSTITTGRADTFPMHHDEFFTPDSRSSRSEWESPVLPEIQPLESIMPSLSETLGVPDSSPRDAPKAAEPQERHKRSNEHVVPLKLDTLNQDSGIKIMDWQSLVVDEDSDRTINSGDFAVEPLRPRPKESKSTLGETDDTGLDTMWIESDSEDEFDDEIDDQDSRVPQTNGRPSSQRSSHCGVIPITLDTPDLRAGQQPPRDEQPKNTQPSHSHQGLPEMVLEDWAFMQPRSISEIQAKEKDSIGRLANRVKRKVFRVSSAPRLETGNISDCRQQLLSSKSPSPIGEGEEGHFLSRMVKRISMRTGPSRFSSQPLPRKPLPETFRHVFHEDRRPTSGSKFDDIHNRLRAFHEQIESPDDSSTRIWSQSVPREKSSTLKHEQSSFTISHVNRQRAPLPKNVIKTSSSLSNLGRRCITPEPFTSSSKTQTQRAKPPAPITVPSLAPIGDLRSSSPWSAKSDTLLAPSTGSSTESSATSSTTAISQASRSTGVGKPLPASPHQMTSPARYKRNTFGTRPETSTPLNDYEEGSSPARDRTISWSGYTSKFRPNSTAEAVLPPPKVVQGPRPCRSAAQMCPSLPQLREGEPF